MVVSGRKSQSLWGALRVFSHSESPGSSSTWQRREPRIFTRLFLAGNTEQKKSKEWSQLIDLSGLKAVVPLLYVMSAGSLVNGSHKKLKLYSSGDMSIGSFFTTFSSSSSLKAPKDPYSTRCFQLHLLCFFLVSMDTNTAFKTLLCPSIFS